MAERCTWSDHREMTRTERMARRQRSRVMVCLAAIWLSFLLCFPNAVLGCECWGRPGSHIDVIWSSEKQAEVLVEDVVLLKFASASNYPNAVGGIGTAEVAQGVVTIMLSGGCCPGAYTLKTTPDNVKAIIDGASTGRLFLSLSAPGPLQPLPNPWSRACFQLGAKTRCVD
jgi:hypothetical protein